MVLNINSCWTEERVQEEMAKYIVDTYEPWEIMSLHLRMPIVGWGNIRIGIIKRAIRREEYYVDGRKVTKL